MPETQTKRGPGRPRTGVTPRHMVHGEVGQELKKWLTAQATIEGRSQGEIIKEALSLYAMIESFNFSSVERADT